MTFATQRVGVTATYTEVAPVSPTGSGSSRWDYWVVDGTTAAENTVADNCLLEQFKNMLSGGRSVSATGHTLVTTRAYAPLAP